MIYPKNPYCPFDKDYMRPDGGNNGNNNNNKPGNGTGGNMGGTGNVNPGTGNNNMGNGNMGNGNIGNGNMGNGNMGNGNMGNGNMGNGNMDNGNMGNGNMGNDCNCGNNGGNNNGNNGGAGNMNRNELMQYISELEFALTDLNLYLDTHPDNAEALEMFTKLAATLKSLKADYARRFAPITAVDVRNETPFEWVSAEHKWPWQA